MRPRVRKPHSALAGTFFLAAGIFVLWDMRGHELGTLRNMGPGYFPSALGGLLILISLAILAESFTGKIEAMEKFDLVSLVAVLTGTTLFGLLLRPAGLIPALIVLTLCAGAAPRSGLGWRRALILGVVLAGASALIFVLLLRQPLPLLGSWFT